MHHHCPAHLGFCYAVQADLELMIPLSPECGEHGLVPPCLSTLPHFILPVLVHFEGLSVVSHEVPWPHRLNTGFPFSFRCSSYVTLASCFFRASVSPRSWNHSWLKKSGTSSECLPVLRGLSNIKVTLYVMTRRHLSVCLTPMDPGQEHEDVMS